MLLLVLLCEEHQPFQTCNLTQQAELPEPIYLQVVVIAPLKQQAADPIHEHTCDLSSASSLASFTAPFCPPTLQCGKSLREGQMRDKRSEANSYGHHYGLQQRGLIRD